MSSSPTATTDRRRRRPTLVVGDERDVEVLRIAHGGHAIAHADGSLLLVRHALPGETVRVRVTEVDRRVVRADAIAVLTASPDRVPAPCEHARPGGCGGCDFQHVAPHRQRELKAEVLTDALRRFGGQEVADVAVQALPGDPAGLHWRSRMRWVAGPDGTLGLRAHRSHDVVAVVSCAIAASGLQPDQLPLTNLSLAPGAEVLAAAGSDGRVAVCVDGEAFGTPTRVVQRVRERDWRVRPTSFWQVHPELAGALTSAVVAMGRPVDGEVWWDLYAGAGLFAAALAEAVGPEGRVEAVESASASVTEGRRALHDLSRVTLHEDTVGRWLPAARDQPDGVVLDPPRSGAGRAVLESLASTGVTRIVYVACDPVALGRDVAILAEHGYELRGVTAFDAFPMTHHLETVALLESAGPHQIS